MSRLPSISGRECIRALEKAGFVVIRRKSTHVFMRRDNPFAQTVVPDHKTIRRGTLRNVIRQAGMTVDEFLALL
jgi:predicted RNA binding protein YcfA (HicA-like mRNA interferase family)